METDENNALYNLPGQASGAEGSPTYPALLASRQRAEPWTAQHGRIQVGREQAVGPVQLNAAKRS